MNFIKQLREKVDNSGVRQLLDKVDNRAAKEKERLDEAIFCGEGERLRRGVYLKKHVAQKNEPTFEYRDGEVKVWLAKASVTELADAKIIAIRSENWFFIEGKREPITRELRERILKDLKMSRQGLFVDKSVYPDESEQKDEAAQDAIDSMEPGNTEMDTDTQGKWTIHK